MKKSLLLLLLMSTALSLGAQSYNTAFGMRLGTDWGLTVKQRIAKKTTLEGILQSSLQREEAILTLLGTQHMPFITRRLNVYAGGGLHKGWGSLETTTNGDPYEDPFGLTLIGGIELSLGRLNLTYDIKPAFNITGGERTMYTQTGISLRYVIVKRKWIQLGDKKKKRQRQRERERRRRKRDKDGFNWRFWEN